MRVIELEEYIQGIEVVLFRETAPIASYPGQTGVPNRDRGSPKPSQAESRLSSQLTSSAYLWTQNLPLITFPTSSFILCLSLLTKIYR